MWRTFIQRSARQRMNSISSASRCAVRTTAVVPSYSSRRSLTTRPRSTKSRVIGVRGIRRRMLDVGPVHVLAGERRGWRRSPRACRPDCRRSGRRRRTSRAVQVLDGVQRGVADRPPAFAPQVLRARLQERPDRRRARSRCRGRRSGSRRAASAAPASRRAARSATSCPARGSRGRSDPASMMAWQSASNRATSSVMLSSTRKIARAPCAFASAMSARTRAKSKVWKLRPRISMIEQKLQSNVQPREVSTTSTWPAEHRVAASTRALRFGSASSPCRSRLTGRSGLWTTCRRRRPPRQAGNRGQARAALERAQQLAERQLAFAAHDDVHADVRSGVRLRREARIVAADDDAHRGAAVA